MGAGEKLEKAFDCRSFLVEEFSRRRERNASYSLRAYSRNLDISLTSLSSVLSGKRCFSKNNLLKIADRLCLSPVERERFLDSGNARRPLDSSDFLKLEEDSFRLICDWYHLAILNLAKIRGNRAEPKWVAERLGISVVETRNALDRLTKMNLLEIKNGKLKRTTKAISTSRDLPSSAIKQYHKQNLRLAEHSLENDPVELREFSSITMAVDPANLGEAKDMLMRMKRRVSKKLETDKPKKVYTLSIQLFPVTK